MSDSTRVVTSEVTVSFPKLVTPEEKPGQKPKWSAAILFYPEQQKTEAGKATLAALKAAILAAAENKFGVKAADMLKNGQLKQPLRSDTAGKGYPEGTIFFNARTVNKPAVVWAHADPANPKKPLRMSDAEVKEHVYPGSKGRASINAFYFDRDGSKGIGFALNNYQKTGEGERIDGRVAAEDEFDVDLSAAPVDISTIVG